MNLRLLLLGVLLVAAPGNAFASEPNHVRILWDVEKGVACARATPLSDSTAFVLPNDWSCVWRPPVDLHKCSSEWCIPSQARPQKGDHVTVYAYHYNAVSYKPVSPFVTTVTPEDPVAIRVFEAVLRTTGMPIPGTKVWSLDLAPADISTCRRPTDAAGCLNAIDTAINHLDSEIQKWSALRADAALIADQRPTIPVKLRTSPGTVSAPNFGIENLEITACRFSVVEHRNPAGGTCPAGSTGWLQNVSQRIGDAAALVRAFDSTYAPGATTEQVTRRDRYKRALDGWVEYLTASQSGARSQLAAGVAQLADDLAAIKAYRAALDRTKAASYAVELPRQGPVGSLHKLVFSLPLRVVGDPDGAPAQLVRTYTLDVPAARPVVTASAGVMWLPAGTFDFKKLAIKQIPAAAPPALSRTLDIQDTDEFRDVTALLATHFRVHPRRHWYATLGTTGDKKIFRTALIGGSFLIPRFRSLITVGALAAKGSVQRDLDGIVTQYSDDQGIVSDSINLLQVFPNEEWHWTGVVGWTLTPF